MQHKLSRRLTLRGGSLLGAFAITCSGLAHGAELTAEQEQLLRAQVDEQTKRLEMLRQQIIEADAKLAEIKSALGIDALRTTRGGTGTAQPVKDGKSFELAQAKPAAAPSSGSQAVAEPGERQGRPLEVAQIFEQPGVLTPKGKFAIEPSLQYAYTSSNRVSIIGYTIIPALTIGLIDLREVRRNTTTAALTGRWGVTNRFELEAKVPYVYRSDDSLERPFNIGSSNDEVFSTSGRGIGDIEVTGRYQFNDGGVDKPYFIGSLRLKSRTGKDPFEVENVVYPSVNPGSAGRGYLPNELPVGSGFYSVQPGLTVLYPSDPAVFFGGLSYQHSIKRSGVELNTTTGDEPIGDVQPGGIWGFNFGMGLAINDRSSFSIGYDHSSVGKTKVNGSTGTGVRTQLGTLLLGFSHRLNASSALNLSVGVGVTRDTPDLTLSMRVPILY